MTLRKLIELVRYEAEFAGAEAAWFCVCCSLADRSAQREGYKNQADRAYTLAVETIAAKRRLTI